MPELPDLLYIVERLRPALAGRTIERVDLFKPVILRVAVEGDPREFLLHRRIDSVSHRGPFLHFLLSGDLDIVVNLMVAGRLQLRTGDEAPIGHRCIAVTMDDGTVLNLGDDRLMAKLYIVHRGEYRTIPRFLNQGVDVLSPSFTPALFDAILRTYRRRQIRVLLNDQTVLSAIGNAYADEILFEAGIHPKTFSSQLSPADARRLHQAVGDVLRRAVTAVRDAGEPIQVKVRAHLRVRNRHGEPCPLCGTTIRREGVRGADVYFCPSCQPAARPLFIDWRSREG